MVSADEKRVGWSAADIAAGVAIVGPGLLVVGVVARMTALATFGSGGYLLFAASPQQLVLTGVASVVMSLPAVALVYFPPFGLRGVFRRRWVVSRLDSVEIALRNVNARSKRLRRASEVATATQSEMEARIAQAPGDDPTLSERAREIVERELRSWEGLFDLELQSIEHQASRLNEIMSRVKEETRRSAVSPLDVRLATLARREWSMMLVYVACAIFLFPNGYAAAASYLSLLGVYFAIPWLWHEGLLRFWRLFVLSTGVAIVFGIIAGLLFAPGWSLEHVAFDHAAKNSPADGIYAYIGTADGFAYLTACNNTSVILSIPTSRIVASESFSSQLFPFEPWLIYDLIHRKFYGLPTVHC